MRRNSDNWNLSFWVFCLITLTAFLLFSSNPNVAESLYGRWFYLSIRQVYDTLFFWLPWPSVYLFMPILLVWLFHPLIKINFIISNRLKQTGRRAIVLICLFYWSWGFNYMRPNLKEKLRISIPQFNQEELFCFYEEACAHVNDIRIGMNDRKYDAADIESTIRSAVFLFLRSRGLPAPAQPRVRQLKPKGILLGTSTAGIYFPFSFEAHIDAGLHEISVPFTMAHEMSHGFGITDEGECNFLGTVACLKSANLRLRYSGSLQVVKWLFYPLVKQGMDPEYLRMYLTEGVKADLKAIRLQHEQYPDYFPVAWRNAIYGRYLKVQGVNSGLKSYGEVVGMLMAYRNEKALY